MKDSNTQEFTCNFWELCYDFARRLTTIVKNILKFRNDRRFKIVQFTDIHWHNGEPPDQQSAKLMTQIAKSESPDLIILTGDILAGGGCEDAADSLRQVMSTVESCSVPWAAVFGNHDDEGSADRHELMAVMQRKQFFSVATGSRRRAGCR